MWCISIKAPLGPVWVFRLVYIRLCAFAIPKLFSLSICVSHLGIQIYHLNPKITYTTQEDTIALVWVLISRFLRSLIKYVGMIPHASWHITGYSSHRLGSSEKILLTVGVISVWILFLRTKSLMVSTTSSWICFQLSVRLGRSIRWLIVSRSLLQNEHFQLLYSAGNLLANMSAVGNSPLIILMTKVLKKLSISPCLLFLLSVLKIFQSRSHHMYVFPPSA